MGTKSRALLLRSRTRDDLEGVRTRLPDGRPADGGCRAVGTRLGRYKVDDHRSVITARGHVSARRKVARLERDVRRDEHGAVHLHGPPSVCRNNMQSGVIGVARQRCEQPPTLRSCMQTVLPYVSLAVTTTVTCVPAVTLPAGHMAVVAAASTGSAYVWWAW